MQGGYISMSTKVLLIFLFFLIQTFLIFLFFNTEFAIFRFFLSCHAAGHPERFNSTLTLLYTLGDKLQQQVETTDHSVWTGPATDKLQQHVVATHRSDKSLCMYWRDFVKIFVSAMEFCRRDNSHKFCLIWFFATCCCDKIMLQKQRFSQKILHLHSKRFVAATCSCYMLLQLVSGPVHTEWSVVATCCYILSPSVYRPLVSPLYETPKVRLWTHRDKLMR